MTAPVIAFVAVIPLDKAHLVKRDNTSLCGANLQGAVLFKWEPGADLGEHKDDCRACLAKVGAA